MQQLQNYPVRKPASKPIQRLSALSGYPDRTPTASRPASAGKRSGTKPPWYRVNAPKDFVRSNALSVSRISEANSISRASESFALGIGSGVDRSGSATPDEDSSMSGSSGNPNLHHRHHHRHQHHTHKGNHTNNEDDSNHHRGCASNSTDNCKGNNPCGSGQRGEDGGAGKHVAYPHEMILGMMYPLPSPLAPPEPATEASANQARLGSERAAAARVGFSELGPGERAARAAKETPAEERPPHRSLRPPVHPAPRPASSDASVIESTLFSGGTPRPASQHPPRAAGSVNATAPDLGRGGQRAPGILASSTPAGPTARPAHRRFSSASSDDMDESAPRPQSESVAQIARLFEAPGSTVWLLDYACLCDLAELPPRQVVHGGPPKAADHGGGKGSGDPDDDEDLEGVAVVVQGFRREISVNSPFSAHRSRTVEQDGKRVRARCLVANAVRDEKASLNGVLRRVTGGDLLVLVRRTPADIVPIRCAEFPSGRPVPVPVYLPCMLQSGQAQHVRCFDLASDDQIAYLEFVRDEFYLANPVFGRYFDHHTYVPTVSRGPFFLKPAQGKPICDALKALLPAAKEVPFVATLSHLVDQKILQHRKK